MEWYHIVIIVLVAIVVILVSVINKFGRVVNESACIIGKGLEKLVGRDFGKKSS